MKSKIVHFSTGHVRNELRVHLKQCHSLAEAGFDVTFVTCDGMGDDDSGEIQVIDIGKPKGRLHRFFWLPMLMLSTLKKMKADLYHFHDPELIFLGLLLQVSGHIVIYDVHEDVPRSILSRDWIPSSLRSLISKVFEYFENSCSARFSGIVGATSEITTRFSHLNSMVVLVRNYALNSEVKREIKPDYYSATVGYFGALSRVRGIYELVEAVKLSKAKKLILAGPVENEQLSNWLLKESQREQKIEYLGVITREEVLMKISECSVGAALYHHEPNHINAEPNKIFEYMSYSLPILGSNFPLWKDLITTGDCGVVVDPLNPSEIADQIDFLVSDPVKCSKIGHNGRSKLEKLYLWSSEFKKLETLYSRLLDHADR